MERRPFTPEDIRRQVVVEEHDLSRDGSLAVVSRRSVRGNRYVRHLWAVPLADGGRGGTRRLTSGSVKDGWPRLSPDGRRVAFIRSYPSGRHPEVVIGLVSTGGGRVRELRPGDHGAIGSLEWSPDGTRLAYTAEVDPPRFLVGDVPPIARKASSKADDATPTARRITRTDWRLDESGHLDRWSHLFVIEAGPGARARRVTAGDWGVDHLAWSPDGRTVAFTSDRGTEPDLHPRTTIWAVDVDAKAPRPREVLAPAGWAANPAWSPDGRWVAAVGILEAETLDDVSPGLLVGPSRRLAPRRTPSPLTSTGPSATGPRRDLNGWIVDGRSGPFWLGGDRIVATVTRPRPLATVGLRPQRWTGRTRGRPPARRWRADDARPGRVVGGRSRLVARHGRRPGDGAADRRGAAARRPASHEPRTRTTTGSAWQRRYLAAGR